MISCLFTAGALALSCPDEILSVAGNLDLQNLQFIANWAYQLVGFVFFSRDVVVYFSFPFPSERWSRLQKQGFSGFISGGGGAIFLRGFQFPMTAFRAAFLAACLSISLSVFFLFYLSGCERFCELSFCARPC